MERQQGKMDSHSVFICDDMYSWMESVPCNHYSVCYNVCYIKQQEKYGRKLEIKEARLLANSLVFCIFIE